MRWTILGVGLLLAVLGSAGTAALVTVARRSLVEAISRRLRGAEESFEWLAETEQLVVAGMAVSSLGVAMVGATIPGLFVGVTVTQLAALSLFLVVPAMLLGGYLLPRWLTAPRASMVVAGVRPLLRGCRALLQLVLPSEPHAGSEDVQALAREGSASGLGSGEELAMVGGVMSFAERPVREVMTPRTDVTAVAEDVSYDAALGIFSSSGYSRLPVYRDTLDEIVGMLHAFDLFKLAPGDPLPLRPVVHAPESRASADLLVDMQRERRHLTVVLDEFGGTAGIVTLEDLLEALVGEISDEDDAEVVAPQVAAGLLELEGAEPVSEVAEHFGVVLPEGGASSLAGLVVEQLGRIPLPGERFTVAGLEIDVIAATPTRIERLIVRRVRPRAGELDRGTR
jgi:putative hemolysin